MSQYPAATSGVGVPESVTLTGTGITKIAQGLYKVTLSLANTNIVMVTPAPVDAAQNGCGVGSAVTYKCYNSNPTSGSANAPAISTSPSYGGQIATVTLQGDGVTGKVVAVSEGEAWVEASYVAGLGAQAAGDNTTPNAQTAGKIYGLLQVIVQK